MMPAQRRDQKIIYPSEGNPCQSISIPYSSKKTKYFAVRKDRSTQRGIPHNIEMIQEVRNFILIENLLQYRDKRGKGKISYRIAQMPRSHPGISFPPPPTIKGSCSLFT
jgi:hypothetical protein